MQPSPIPQPVPQPWAVLPLLVLPLFGPLPAFPALRGGGVDGHDGFCPFLALALMSVHTLVAGGSLEKGSLRQRELMPVFCKIFTSQAGPMLHFADSPR